MFVQSRTHGEGIPGCLTEVFLATRTTRATNCHRLRGCHVVSHNTSKQRLYDTFMGSYLGMSAAPAVTTTTTQTQTERNISVPGETQKQPHER